MKNLRGDPQHWRAREIDSKGVSTDAVALMVFIKRDQSLMRSNGIDRELQVVACPNAAIRDEVRIAEQNDAARPVRIVDE